MTLEGAAYEIVISVRSVVEWRLSYYGTMIRTGPPYARVFEPAKMQRIETSKESTSAQAHIRKEKKKKTFLPR
jgi:hypothetical protein